MILHDWDKEIIGKMFDSHVSVPDITAKGMSIVSVDYDIIEEEENATTTEKEYYEDQMCVL